MIHPSYVALLKSGELERRVNQALSDLEHCNLCPRNCGVNRIKNEKGFCKTGRFAFVSSHNLHNGEEPPISGENGSGTIFFTNCNLRCKFCQNYPISQLGNGVEAPPNILSQMMLDLQKRGAHNINLVTPSHVTTQFIEALFIAAENGLNIPIVYNSNGYEALKSLKLLDGIIDIYMPDIKYSNNESSIKCSEAPNYFEISKKAIEEMYKQVGNFTLNNQNIGIKGLLIRHLVLPNDLSGSERSFDFIANKLSNKIPVNCMSQYFPAWKAKNEKDLERKITKQEYEHALNLLDKYKLSEGWKQEAP